MKRTQRKDLTFMQLNLGVFIFLFGQWKSRQANKDGSQSQKLGNWTVVLTGGFREGLGSLHPNGLFHTVFYRAAILIQFYFDLCNCYAAQAQHCPIYIGLKIMLVDSSLNEIKLPLQFISRSYMSHAVLCPSWVLHLISPLVTQVSFLYPPHHVFNLHYYSCNLSLSNFTFTIFFRFSHMKSQHLSFWSALDFQMWYHSWHSEWRWRVVHFSRTYTWIKSVSFIVNEQMTNGFTPIVSWVKVAIPHQTTKGLKA